MLEVKRASTKSPSVAKGGRKEYAHRATDVAHVEEFVGDGLGRQRHGSRFILAMGDHDFYDASDTSPEDIHNLEFVAESHISSFGEVHRSNHICPTTKIFSLLKVYVNSQAFRLGENNSGGQWRYN